MDGEKLFDLFVAHSTTVGEIARMDLDTLAKQIRELRDEEGDYLFWWTDAAIATAILGYAKPIVYKEYLDALDTHARDPCWPSSIAPNRWEPFPQFEEWALREYEIVIERRK